jgi:predicted Ser/Thr protein kinase
LRRNTLTHRLPVGSLSGLLRQGDGLSLTIRAAHKRDTSLTVIDEILDAHCSGQSTLEEATAALLRAREDHLVDDADIEAALERRVASGSLTAEAAAALTARPAAAEARSEQTMLRPSTDVPPPMVAQLASAPSGASGSGSSGWRKWAESDVQGARIGVGDVLRDRFEIEEALGEGGMGLVFRARDRRREEARDRNPFVAIKLLGDDFKSHPDALISLQREARRMQQLSHPNIASVYDFDRDGPHVYLVMELLEGESLDKVLARHANEGLPPEQAAKLIEGAGSALRHAHSKGVVHSDFKPANVFLTRSGDVKIIDFGIARIAKDSTPGGEATMTVFDAGRLGAWTNAYASPEQILAAAEPDPRDDVYAFGLVAYEVLAGKHPFGRKSAVEAQFRGMKYEPIPGLTQSQNSVLASALSFDREQRLGDVMALVQSLAPSDEPIIATRDGVRPMDARGREQEPAHRGRRMGRTVAMAVGGLAWVAFFAFYWTARDSTPTEATTPDTQATAGAAPEPVSESPMAPVTGATPKADTVPVVKPATRPIAPAPTAGSSPQLAVAPPIGPVEREPSSPTSLPNEGAREPSKAAGAVADAPVAEAAEPPTDPGTDATQLFRWVDQDGKIQFGENPPAEFADTAVKVMDL